mmetsp:Transcript_47121/g.118693  ORF Transcript_47121/g.118693 Transcript_47121/m.118693 type:complete len:298 (-) Transcript_47121:312-1205(-)
MRIACRGCCRRRWLRGRGGSAAVAALAALAATAAASGVASDTAAGLDPRKLLLLLLLRRRPQPRARSKVSEDSFELLLRAEPTALRAVIHEALEATEIQLGRLRPTGSGAGAAASCPVLLGPLRSVALEAEMVGEGPQLRLAEVAVAVGVEDVEDLLHEADPICGAHGRFHGALLDLQLQGAADRLQLVVVAVAAVVALVADELLQQLHRDALRRVRTIVRAEQLVLILPMRLVHVLRAGLQSERSHLPGVEQPVTVDVAELEDGLHNVLARCFGGLCRGGVLLSPEVRGRLHLQLR